MVLIELCGGPGSGKSTLSAFLFYKLKKKGFRVELVGEAAREIIYTGNPHSTPHPLIDNQVLLAGLQYERVLRLQRHGIQVAITDSPLLQGTMYCQKDSYHNALKECIQHLKAIPTLNVFIKRTKGKYDPESRVQRTEAEAVAFDNEVRNLLGPFWAETSWNKEEDLAKKIIRKLKNLGC